MDGSGLPAGLADDISWINAHATENVSDAFYSTPSLSKVGTSAEPLWDQLRPYSFQSQDPSSNTTTYTANDGTVSTLVTHRSVSASYSTGSGSGSGSGSGGGGGGYSWTSYYVSHDDSTDTITGTDANGHPFTEVHSRSDDLNWQGSGGGSGAAHYKVKHDGTQSDSREVDGTSTRVDTSSAEGHVTVEGDVNSSGGVSGTYTLAGDFKVGDSLADQSGDPSSSGAGYTANYSGTTTFTLNASGDYETDATQQVSSNVKDSETGTIGVFDGSNGLQGVTRDDFNQVKANYDGSGNATPGGQASDPSAPAAEATPAAGPPATKGPVNVNGPLTELNVPKGKAVAYIIDLNDKGWDDWTEEDRAAYREKYNIPADAQNVIGSGAKIKEALSPLQGPVLGASSLGQITKDLGTATATFKSKLDVLVIGDHGSVGSQQLGTQFAPSITPQLLREPTAADQLVAFIKPGGTLIATGCNVLGDGSANGQQSLNDWQAYATARNITIIGSVSYTAAKRTDTFRGIWVTLVPGGTAPQLVSN